MNEPTGIKPWQWAVTAIVVIVLIILAFTMFGGDSTTDMDSDDTTTPATNTATGANRIMVADQYPGNVVYISSAQLANAGWVVIHKDDAGKPGAIIGFAYFEKGINPGRVLLTESTVNGGTYYAMLHSDNGDKKFDATVDVPLKDAQGSIIMKMFKATESVTEFKG